LGAQESGMEAYDLPFSNDEKPKGNLKGRYHGGKKKQQKGEEFNSTTTTCHFRRV